jgi:uncharacterized protein (TIGR02246 family)
MYDLAVIALYETVLAAWNARDAVGFARVYAENGSQIGFDGSQINGRRQIEEHLTVIFADHRPAAFVGIVREIRELSTDVALLRAVAGMVPPNTGEIKPELNAIQSLVAVRMNGQWQVALFHNTPARFDERPDDVAALTAELRAELEKRGVAGSTSRS